MILSENHDRRLEANGAKSAGEWGHTVVRRLSNAPYPLPEPCVIQLSLLGDPGKVVF